MFTVDVDFEVVDCGYRTPCHVWRRGFDTHGYGRLWHRGRADGAHRVAYIEARGPIPDGLEVDHLCRVRACVNVDHLEAVTHRENLRRGAKVFKLTDEQVAAVRVDPRSCRAVAADFGISAMQVSRIRRGRRSGSAV